MSDENISNQQRAFKSWVELHTKNDICILPNVYLDNEDCSPCEYYNFCLNSIKRHPKITKSK